MGQGRGALLFCKKEAKNFLTLGHGRLKRHGPKLTKFFCFFFVQKKEDLPCLTDLPPGS
jgi:hypothetical protein